jgi:hypothetical protein
VSVANNTIRGKRIGALWRICYVAFAELKQRRTARWPGYL